MNEAEPEKSVFQRLRLDMGDAISVAGDRDRRLRARHGYLAARFGKRTAKVNGDSRDARGENGYNEGEADACPFQNA